MIRNFEKEKRRRELSLVFRSLESPLSHSDNRHTKVSQKSDSKDKESRKPTVKKELSVVQCQKVDKKLKETSSCLSRSGGDGCVGALPPCFFFAIRFPRVAEPPRDRGGCGEKGRVSG
jgi:hypothetical protein